MTPTTTLVPSEAPRGLPCAVRGCERSRMRDSLRCPECTANTWLLREPEWVRRAKASALVAKDYSGTAA